MKFLFAALRLVLLTFLLVSLRTVSFKLSSGMSQRPFDVEVDRWQVRLSSDWDVLGPFHIHAREQHFISPGFPLNLTIPYHHEADAIWPSSLGESTEVTWRRVQSDFYGNLVVSFPEVRWSRIRATEGWAGLQHHTILHTTLILQPPRSAKPAVQLPRILIQLTQASFFTILPREGSGLHPEWHTGNIYNMSRAPANAVELSGAVHFDRPTIFDFFVSGDYEIRLFNDPRDNGQETPTLRLNAAVSVEENQRTIVREDSHDVICDFVDGFAFGDALGVGLRSVDGWWSVMGIEVPEHFPGGISLNVLGRQLIAPSQTRIVPISIAQTQRYRGSALNFNIILAEKDRNSSDAEPTSISVPITLALRQLPTWNPSTWEPIRVAFFYASSHPTYFLAKPPIVPSPDGRSVPILALHGAGVDIISEPLWADAIPRQKHSWIVMPFGRTEWGLDWHGPSASEAWATLPALSNILHRNKSWKIWNFPPDSRALILGHSNGGQGTWCLASRFPDRTHAAIAAAGFLNAAAYVPLTLSRGARFVDPALRSVLESSFVPDDNALFLGNLADSVPVLAVHGGNDTNVPTWHSREYVSIIKALGHGRNISFHEDEGQPHWYSTVFESEKVQTFLQEALQSGDQYPGPTSKVFEFTLTVADPVRSGSKNGWRIDQLVIPGRLGRLHVRVLYDRVVVKTTNVHRFRVAYSSSWIRETVIINQSSFSRAFEENHERSFALVSPGTWAEEKDSQSSLSSPPGRVQNIFDTSAPLTIVISSNSSVYPTSLSAALRIAQTLNVYLKLDSEILLDIEAVDTLEGDLAGTSRDRLRGNLVILGGRENALSRRLLMRPQSDLQTEFGIPEDGCWLFRGQVLDKGDEDLGILFTHPHPTNPLSMAVFLSGTSMTGGTNSQGFERVLRLFVPRTGIAVPDWILVGNEMDQFGAGGVVGAGVWDPKWKWSDPMSYIP